MLCLVSYWWYQRCYLSRILMCILSLDEYKRHYILVDWSCWLDYLVGFFEPSVWLLISSSLQMKSLTLSHNSCALDLGIEVCYMLDIVSLLTCCGLRDLIRLCAFIWPPRFLLICEVTWFFGNLYQTFRVYIQPQGLSPSLWCPLIYRVIIPPLGSLLYFITMTSYISSLCGTRCIFSFLSA